MIYSITKYLTVLFFLIAHFSVLTQPSIAQYSIQKIEADKSKAFSYPYFLYIPDSLTKEAAKNSVPITMMVVPNNSGRLNDTLAFHEVVAKNQLLIWAKIANKLNTVIVMPVFPRTKKEPDIYTHALDRDVMLTHLNEYKRLDLQLEDMIKDAAIVLGKKNIIADNRIWLTGFSASGMFANRFAFLHPTLVKAVAAGSPGGWPIAPVEMYNGKKLRYPIGVNDYSLVSGKGLNRKSLSKIPIFIYMGDEDDNDSVVFSDGYAPEDKELIFELFGSTPLKRWQISEALYKSQNMDAFFKLYKGVKHTINNEMIADIVEFFKKSK
jgi:dienelactone hydrolase